MTSSSPSDPPPPGDALDAMRRQFDAFVESQQQVAERAMIEARRAVEAEFAAERQKLDQLKADLDAERAKVALAARKAQEERHSYDHRMMQLTSQRLGLEAQAAEIEQREEKLRAKAAEQAQRIKQLNEQATKINDAKSRYAERNAQLEKALAELSDREDQFARRSKRTVGWLRRRRIKFEKEASQRAQLLNERAHEYETVRQHLRRRRKRLKLSRQLMRERSREVRQQHASVEPLRQAAQSIVTQRQSLREVQMKLAEAEQKMIHRWAQHRGVPATLAASICLVLLMAGSYFVSDKLASQTWVADALVENTDSALAARPDWVDQQRVLLTSTNAVNRAANAIRMNGYTGAAQPEYLQQRLGEGLTLYAKGPGRLQIELTGSNRRELQPILGALVEAYTALAQNSAVTGSSINTLTVVRPATLDPAPLSSNRLTIASAMFFSGIAALMAIFLFVRRSLISLQHVHMIDDPDTHIDSEIWKRNVELINRAIAPGDDDGPVIIKDADDPPGKQWAAELQRFKPAA
ncbi:MAG: hypothetical protein GC162_03905 [Planctomycetes bacterium]|nr:hypothetical protein [Planctomycetota bacterium]